jgi:hypothetical protein
VGCLIHEVKHLHQKYCISHKKYKNIKFANSEMINQWEKDFKCNQHLISESQLICLSIEIDCYAFTRFIFDEWYNIDFKQFDELYVNMLDAYINKFFK